MGPEYAEMLKAANIPTRHAFKIVIFIFLIIYTQMSAGGIRENVQMEPFNMPEWPFARIWEKNDKILGIKTLQTHVWGVSFFLLNRGSRNYYAGSVGIYIGVEANLH